MNKKIYLTSFWLFLIFFVWINFFQAKAFYFNIEWKKFFDEEKFLEAEKKFSKTWEKFWEYNLANSFYKEKKYKEAIKKYFSILWNEKNNFNFDVKYNIWNSYFRIWENEDEKELKIKYWKKAVEYYQKALDIKFDEKAKRNIEFILKKIWEEEKNDGKKDDKNKNWNKKWDKKDWDKNWNKKWDKKDWEKNWQKQDWEKSKDWKKGKDWEKWEKNKNWKQSWKSWEQDKRQLSNEQMKAVEQYEKQLKKEQKKNQWDFNKVYQPQQSNDPFDSFFDNDPFFNNWLLNWWEKKDW